MNDDAPSHPQCEACGDTVFVTEATLRSAEMRDRVLRKHRLACPAVRLELERRKIAALEQLARTFHGALELAWHLYNEGHETGRDAVQHSATPELERRCDCQTPCPTPGPMNGCACGAARSGRPFSAQHWCGCSCHLPIATTSGGTPP